MGLIIYSMSNIAFKSFVILFMSSRLAPLFAKSSISLCSMNVSFWKMDFGKQFMNSSPLFSNWLIKFLIVFVSLVFVVQLGWFSQNLLICVKMLLSLFSLCSIIPIVFIFSRLSNVNSTFSYLRFSSVLLSLVVAVPWNTFSIPLISCYGNNFSIINMCKLYM